MRLPKPLLAAAGVVFGLSAVRADVKPHALFTDHMVLQRGGTIPVWGTADPGEAVEVTLGGRADTGTGVAAPANGTAKATAGADGKWRVELAGHDAGNGFTLTIKGKNTVELKDVAVGEVWVCSGQSNMEWPFVLLRGGKELATKAVDPNVRLFTVPRRPATEPQTEFGKGPSWQAKWLESDPDSVFTFSAVGYYFGTNIQKALKVPVGLIHTSWGGTPAEAWTSREALAGNDELKHYVAAAGQSTAGGTRRINQNTPTALYNGMIHPLLPFAIKGAIWYQGESNAGRAAEYRTLYPAMIEDWRKRWGHDLPFFGVSLAPFHAGDAEGVSWAELREAQFLATKKLPKVGLAVTTDVGDLFDIHPQQKQPVGDRLAAAAKAIAYGQPIESSGPVYKDMAVDGNKAVLTFDHLGGGLVAKGAGNGVVNGFTVCGDDRYFYPAKAVVKGDTVVVTCEKVAKPVAVRFGWANFPVCSLFNKAGLPAVPFRTDDFPLTTAKK